MITGVGNVENMIAMENVIQIRFRKIHADINARIANVHRAIRQETSSMTDNEWVLYCLIAAAVIITAIVMHQYPIQDTINATSVIMMRSP